MKTIFRITFPLLFGVVLLQSCDKISEPYYTSKSVYADTNKRSVLIEDYTGHLCVNCAPAAKVANSIQDMYEGQVFVMAVHAGDFARAIPGDPYLSADYTTPAGDEWNTYSGFGIEAAGYPRGLVSRRTFKGSINFGPSDWAQAVEAAVLLPKVAIITVNNNFNAQTKVLNTKVDVKFLVNYPGNVDLTVCLLEDSIYGGQVNKIPPDSTPLIKHFRFMHMLRATFNDATWGEEIASNPNAGAIISKPYTFEEFQTQPWGPQHCSVIAFISDAETKEVLHIVKSADLKP